MDDDAASSPLLTPTRCFNLRTKALYVSALAASAFGDDDQEPPICWCNRTLREQGPDEEPADLHSCSDPARACYQGPPV
jgi:hypothetical protein